MVSKERFWEIVGKTGVVKIKNPLIYNGLTFIFGGADGTRTRDPRRDRPLF